MKRLAAAILVFWISACSQDDGLTETVGDASIETASSDKHEEAFSEPLLETFEDPVAELTDLAEDVLSPVEAFDTVEPQDVEAKDLFDSMATEEISETSQDFIEENGCMPPDIYLEETSIEVSQDVWKDPCDPNPCTTPPPNTCADDKTVLTYAKTGDCTVSDNNAHCHYEATTTDCSLDGRICYEGACIDLENPCVPNPCTSPPPDVCDADGFTLLKYENVGECTTYSGMPLCAYAEIAIDCSLMDQVCEDASCKDPCDPNPCTSPPAPECDVGGVILWMYEGIGDCVAPWGMVSCDYQPFSVDCSITGKKCENGECVLKEASCPEDMALVPLGNGKGVCMDRWEASRADATADSAGVSEVASSRPGVIPWYVTTMSLAALDAFEAGCKAAGKRLCSKEEWFEACNGPDNTVYFFGNTWDPEVCNCVDTFCDDWCLEKGISPCNTNENCGYQYYCFHVVPTGTFPNCTNAYGLFDVNGNVWEVVPVNNERGYEVRGGAFNCGNPSVRLRCDFNAGWDQLYAGFRCCKDL